MAFLISIVKKKMKKKNNVDFPLLFCWVLWGVFLLTLLGHPSSHTVFSWILVVQALDFSDSVLSTIVF